MPERSLRHEPDTPNKGTATFVVASSTASQAVKQAADFVCNGTADDVEIQAALDAAALVKGAVHCTEGVYAISATLTINDDTTLQGVPEGTVFSLDSEVDDSVIENDDPSGGDANIVLRDFKIDGNQATNDAAGSHGIFMDKVTGLRIEGVNVFDCFDVGIYTDNSADVQINQCSVGGTETTVAFHVKIQTTTDVQIANVIVQNGHYGFYIEDCDYVSLVNCDAKGTADDALVVGVGAAASNYVSVVGCHFQGSTGDKGAHILECNYVTIADTIFEGNSSFGVVVDEAAKYISFSACHFQGNGNSGINLGSSHSSIIGGTAVGNTNHGVIVTATTAVGDVLVKDMVCTDNTVGGIVISTNATKVMVQGNRCGNVVASAQNYGLHIDAAGVGATSIISNNDFRDNATNTILNASTSADIIFHNNSSDLTADLASATTITIPPDYDFYNLTGSTAITGITASWAGRRVSLKFGGNITVTDGNNIILAGGANMVGVANDTITLVSDATNWYEESRADNTP